MRNKKPYELSVKKSVSMPEMLFVKAQDRMGLFGLTQFSDYIQKLMREDLQQQNSAHQIKEAA